MTGRGRTRSERVLLPSAEAPQAAYRPLEGAGTHLLPAAARVVPYWAWPRRRPTTKSPGFRALLTN